MIIPDSCLPVLRMQRTTENNFEEWFKRDFDQIEKYLEGKKSVLDIGCGIGGIDVLIYKKYKPKIVLYDFDKIDPKLHFGFRERASIYNSAHAIKSLMFSNEIYEYEFLDAGIFPYPEEHFDAVISLLSLGHHYPVDTYEIKLNKGGVFIADIRNDTDGIIKLEKKYNVNVIAEQNKSKRVVCYEK